MNSGHERSRSSVQRGGVWGGFAGSKSFPMRYFTVLNAVALNSLSEMKTTDDPSQWDQLEHTFRPKDPPAYFILKYSHVIDKPRSRFLFQITRSRSAVSKWNLSLNVYFFQHFQDLRDHVNTSPDGNDMMLFARLQFRLLFLDYPSIHNCRHRALIEDAPNIVAENKTRLSPAIYRQVRDVSKIHNAYCVRFLGTYARRLQERETYQPIDPKLRARRSKTFSKLLQTQMSRIGVKSLIFESFESFAVHFRWASHDSNSRDWNEFYKFHKC